MEEMNNLTTKMINEISNNNIKEETYEIIVKPKRDLTRDELLTLQCVRRLKNPFRMITVEDVMRDLKICRVVAYKLFQREDFPSINIGKTHQVMLLAYIVWKMNKRD